MYRLTLANVEEIKAELRDGRVVRLRCTDENGKEKVIPIAKFISDAGRLLGWNVVKSNLFVIQKSSHGWVLEGQGLGHGVGLCQYGAAELARQDFSYEKILEFYYPGARLARGAD
jgi:stage II sporulation protein D